jgi:hypothetical protein
MSGNFTVLSPEEEARVRKLEAFYKTIRDLAVKTNLNKTTLIYEALSEVNPNWNEDMTIWDHFEWVSPN